MRQAFSLVELSIVLVILGLLTGGILAGQSLIRAAELRAATTEFERYTAATHSFRGKYFALPGDFNNAIQFWGDDVAACSDGNAGNNGTPGTCNGDGDGMIEDAAAPSTTGEKLQFWKHLALGGLIEGTYTGIAGTSGFQHMLIGQNVPRSRLPSGGWGASYYDTSAAADATSFSLNYANHLILGAETSNSSPSGPLLRPEEAWNLDNKFDDGRPGIGRVIATNWSSCSNAADSYAVNATYRLENPAIACGLRIRVGF